MTRILQHLPGWLIRPYVYSSSKIDSYWVNIYIHISSTYHLRVCDTPVLHGIFQLWSLQPPLWWLHHHLTQPKSCCLTPQKALSSLEKTGIYVGMPQYYITYSIPYWEFILGWITYSLFPYSSWYIPDYSWKKDRTFGGGEPPDRSKQLLCFCLEQLACNRWLSHIFRWFQMV